MATNDHDALSLVGTTEREPEPLRLAAGALSLEFQGGGLRYVRYGGHEIVRAVSFLARDKNWGTYPLDLGDVEVKTDDDAFALRFSGRCGPTGKELRIEASIEGRSDGTLIFRAHGVLDDDLLTNRTGFVVLHPLDVSGRPVVVERVDGSCETTRFPEQIDPLQPFRDIRALTTQYSDSLAAEVRMEGDTFEMEDQRNWSDASFKTYVRPLALPWPYTLAKGEVLEQSVMVRVMNSAPAAQSATSVVAERESVRVTLGATTTKAAPLLGIGVRAEHIGDALASADALRALGPAYFVSHLDVRHDDVAGAMAGFARLSEASGVPYVLEIVLSGDGDPAAEMKRVADAARGLRAPVAVQASPAPDLKAVLPGSPWPPCPSFEEVFSAARAAFPGVPLGGGSFAYFTEFNRKRAPFGLLDYATFTTCPIVHAADDRSVMETLATLPFIASSAAKVAGGTPLRVGPSTIAARDNPYGSATLANEIGPAARRICLTDNDPRQRARFGAAWNLGYFAAFARGGATHIALSELTGPRGVLDEVGKTPLFTVLASLAAAQGQAMRDVEVTQSDHAAALATFAVGEGTRVTIWLANLSAAPLAVDTPFDIDTPTRTLAAYETVVIHAEA